MKQKTNRLHFSTRTLAMVLSIVMLIGSIATGSMLNTFAAYLQDAAQSDAVTQAASEGSDIALNAIPSQDAGAANITDNNDAKDAPDLSGFEENEIVRGMKDDFAYTAAKLDLAATGTTYYLWTTTNGGTYSTFRMVGEMTGDGDGTVSGSFTHSGTGNIYFIINTSSTSASSGDVITQGFSGITVTNTDSSLFNDAFCQSCWNDGGNVYSVGISMKNGSERTIYVTYNPSTSTITYGGSSSGGGGSTTYYTVAGDKVEGTENIFGTSFDTTNTDNDMSISSDSTYIKTYTMPATTDLSEFQFKIAKNHTWDTAYPENSGRANVVIERDTNEEKSILNITTADTYKLNWAAGDILTISFNTSTKNIGVSFVTPETRYDVTISNGVGGTLSPSGTQSVGAVTGLEVIAQENPGYEFAGWSIGAGVNVTSGTATGAVASQTKTITIKPIAGAAEGTRTVFATFTKLPTYPVTVLTNNAALGTASASTAYGYQGQSITLTALDADGTFANWTVQSGTVSIVSTTSKSTTFTMPASAVTIKANFNPYQSTNTSTWYYNGYNDSAAAVSGKYAQRMIEGKVNGAKYSYYHVTGRSDNKAFTLSKYSPDWDNTNTYIYFIRPNNWNDWGYRSGSEACFLASDGTYIQDWTNMAGDGWCGTENNSDYRFRTTVPDGAKYVIFREATYTDDAHKTVNIDLSANTHNCWSMPGSKDGSVREVTGSNYNSGSDPVPAGFNEYFNCEKYSDAFDTGGFTVHGMNKGGYHHFTKPNGSVSDYYVLVLYKGNTYTINGVTQEVEDDTFIWVTELPTVEDETTIKLYAKDGALRNDSSRDLFANYADTKIYDAGGNPVGTSHSYVNNQSYETYRAAKGETITIKTIISNTAATGVSGNFNDLYCVKGFCVNGEVPENTIDPEGKAVTGGTEYTLTYTIPEDFEGDVIEVTPIYYLKDKTLKTITFFVDNFPKDQYNWGNTVYVYPFYDKLSDSNNAFGSYPGQPMVFYGGQYYIQIPVKDVSPFALDHGNNNADDSILGGNNNAANRKNFNVAGITLHNGYYDTLHNEIWKYNTTNQSVYQTQTYDYDDFYKIYNEKENVDNIVFQYKYRTANDNKTDLASFTPDSTSRSQAENTTYFSSTFANGFEELRNFHGRRVNIFGDPISGATLNNNPIYVVSDAGGPNEATTNVAGRFATQWHIFVPKDQTGNTTYQKFTISNGKTSIPPSVLLLNDEDSFNDTVYPSAGANNKITDWKTYYTTLKASYTNYPVLITYEKAKGDETSDEATRNDGRWLYSSKGESITANIRVDYTDDGTTWVTNPSDTEDANYRSGLSAFFSNSEAYGKQTYATTIDPDKTFDLEAKSTNGSYKFVGWYIENGTRISTSNKANTSRSGPYTFVAKFKLVTSGQLILSHSEATGTIDGNKYEGTGAAEIAVSVSDAVTGDTIKEFSSTTDDITLDDQFIGNTRNYNITVTLKATAGNNSMLGTTVLDHNPAAVTDALFFNYGSYSESGKSRTYSFSFNVIDDLYGGTSTQKTTSLFYYSYFGSYTFKYNINFEFYDRFDTVSTSGGNETHSTAKKILNKQGTLTAKEAELYVYKKDVTVDGNTTQWRFLRKEFVESIAPYESNFNQELKWVFNSEPNFDGEEAGANYVYTCTAHYAATPTTDLYRDVTFNLPYEHTDGVATLDDGGIGTASSTTNLSFLKKEDKGVLYGTIPTIKGVDEEGHEADVWITAPATIKGENDTIQHFRYWSIASTSSPDIEAARCYYVGFNFVAYDNYIITAVYGDPFDYKTDAGTFATYLGTTRNQWNCLSTTLTEDCGKTVSKNDRTTAADVLFNDFILNYNYHGEDLYLQEANEGSVSNIGVVVERIRTLDKNSDDTYDTTLLNYITAPTTEEQDTVKDIINGTSSDARFTKQEITKKSLDNKNRIEIFEALYNGAGWNKDKQASAAKYTYKNYLYRAYTYMIVNGEIILSQNPAYFIMYDEATK